MDVIGMTNLQEARLAREAEICYATLAMVTDYDCWHPDHESVTADQIIAEPRDATPPVGQGRAARRRCSGCRGSRGPASARPRCATPWSPPARAGAGRRQARAGADHREVHAAEAR